MAITPYAAPFAAGSTSARRSGEQFVAIRRDLDALQRQFATGLKTDTYGGLGLERRTSLDVRAKLSAIAGYGEAIKGAELRLTLMTQGIERLASGVRDTKAALFPPKFDAGLDGRTTAQKSAEQRLSLAIDVLNAEVDGRHLFGGRAQDAAPVESMAKILDGDPSTGRKGLRHLIAERKAADQGADDLGRLAMPAPGSPSEVRLAEDANPGLRQNFGFRLLGAQGVPGAITLASTPAANPTATLTFGAVPQDGDAVRVYVNGPDGRQSTVDLTARTAPNPANAGSEFLIGADAATSAANLVAALPPGSTIAGVQSKPGAGALTVAFSGGAAASHTFEVTAPPAPGASISVTLGLRDGSERTVTLTARAAADPASATEFAIGATNDATAANLSGALRRAIQAESRSSLAATSAVMASDDFFSASGSPARWPRRVEPAGTPASLAAATGTAAGTAANTVLWYKGDDTAASARGATPLRVDQNQVVGTGAQANEVAIRGAVAQFAVLAAERFSTSALDRERYDLLADKVRTRLGETGQPQNLEEVATELGSAMAAMTAAKERHQATGAVLQTALDDVEAANPEEVAAAIMALQTRLQASYQTTSILSRLSIVNYL